MNMLTRRALAATPLMLAAGHARAAGAGGQADTPDATALAAAIRRGETTALALVEAAIARAEALQPALGAISNSDFDRALATARSGSIPGPFGGVPFLAGGAGTRAPFEALGFLSLGASAPFPPARNPWRPARGGGGIAAGAAAAVAAGITPLAYASEVGGGLRWAASATGLFGLKPSRARMARERDRRQLSDHAVTHVLTRSVRDSAAVFVALQDIAPGRAYPPLTLTARPSRRRLRIGLVTASITGRDPTPEVRAAVDDAAGLLAALGHRLVPTAWPVRPEFVNDFFALSGAGGAAALERIYRDTVAYDPWFVGQQLDLILSPVQGDASAPVADLRSEDHSYTAYHNMVGAPAMSVPLHWTPQGLPIGVQVFARVGAEAMLFDLAFQMEARRPWAGRRPPIAAA